jgi:hypothetical protein
MDHKNLSLNFACPICGAPPQKKCVMTSGAPRFESHVERWNIAKDHLYGHSMDETIMERVTTILQF